MNELNGYNLQQQSPSLSLQLKQEFTRREHSALCQAEIHGTRIFKLLRGSENQYPYLRPFHPGESGVPDEEEVLQKAVNF